MACCPAPRLAPPPVAPPPVAPLPVVPFPVVLLPVVLLPVVLLPVVLLPVVLLPVVLLPVVLLPVVLLPVVLLPVVLLPVLAGPPVVGCPRRVARVAARGAAPAEAGDGRGATAAPRRDGRVSGAQAPKRDGRASSGAHARRAGSAPEGQSAPIPAGLAPRRPQRLQYSAPSVDGGTHVETSQGPAVNDDFAHVGRNDPCPCGSGRKFKRCHGDPRMRPDA